MSSNQPPPQTPSPTGQLPLLALPDDWEGFSPRSGGAALTGVAARRAQLIAGVLPDFLRRQRWFAAKGLAFDRVAIDWQAVVDREPPCLWLQVSIPDAADQRYSLPLALAWDADNENAPGIKIDAADIVARVRQARRNGILYDAFADPSFCHRLLAVMSGQQRLTATGGRISGTSTARLAPALAALTAPWPLQRIAAASSNTTLAIGDRLLLKAYRRLRPGINVEQEIGLFLGDVSPYRHCAPLAGLLELLGLVASQANSV